MTRIKNIDVVGAGTAGCLAVLYLSKKFPSVKFNWYFPERNNPIGVGEGSTPELIDILKAVNITFPLLVKRCDATLKLGIQFDKWKNSDHRYFHPFSTQSGGIDEMADMCILQQKNKIPLDIFNSYSYSIHFDSCKLQTLIMEVCETQRNVSIYRKSITTTDELKGDLLIDCTGFKGLAAENQTHSYSDSAEDKNNNNEAKVIKFKYTDSDTQSVPYTTATASQKNGWFWYIPLRYEIGFGHVYNNRMEDNHDEFEHYIKSVLGVDHIDGEYHKIEFTTGRVDDNLIKDDDRHYYNIGLSSGFIEPLEAKGLYISIESIYLIEEFLSNKMTVYHVNRRFREIYDSCVDFIHLHYHHADRIGPYWDFYKRTAPNFQVTNEYEWVKTCMDSDSGWDHDLMRKCMVAFHDYTPTKTIRTTQMEMSAIKYNEWKSQYEI